MRLTLRIESEDGAEISSHPIEDPRADKLITVHWEADRMYVIRSVESFGGELAWVQVGNIIFYSNLTSGITFDRPLVLPGVRVSMLVGKGTTAVVIKVTSAEIKSVASSAEIL